jgi:hypothetical protein
LLLLATLKLIIVGDGAVAILILFLAIGLLPIFVREFRSSLRLSLAYWFVIALHQAVAFINKFMFVTPGAESDAVRFHKMAEVIARSENFSFTIISGGLEVFCNLLGFLYWLAYPSILLGSQMSILAFAISCIILIKILGLMELSRYRVSVLLAFGSLPSMVLLGSIPLRESFQLLFFMLAVYFGIKMHLKENVKLYGLFMVASAFAMGLFHQALMKYSVVFIALFLVWNPHPTSSWLAVKKRHLMSVLAVIILLGSGFLLIKMRFINISFFSSLIDLDLWETVTSFRIRSERALSRATYEVVMDFSSVFMITWTSLLFYIHYLFAPFPWQIGSVLDFFAFLESTLRMVLIYFSVKHWSSTYGQKRKLIGFMLILFFSMSFMWALGTTNYGTSVRHNLLSWWILAVVGAPLLIERLCNLKKYFSIRRQLNSLGET